GIMADGVVGSANAGGGGVALTVDSNLKQATLIATVPMHDLGGLTPAFDLNLNLVWNATGPMITGSSVSNTRPDGTVEIDSFHGQLRNASAQGAASAPGAVAGSFFDGTETEVTPQFVIDTLHSNMASTPSAQALTEDLTTETMAIVP